MGNKTFDNYIKTEYCIFLLIFFLTLPNCKQYSEKEKQHKSRDNIINIQNLLREIRFDSVYFSNFAKIYPTRKHLIVSDYKSLTNHIYLFDKTNFKLLAETAPHGQGPNEITNLGHIAVNEQENAFYVTDHGKQKIFAYHSDSVIMNSSYKPAVKLNIKEQQFPNEYIFVNDSICFGTIMEPTNSGFDIVTAKWNINSGEISPMKYKHPEIKRKRISFAFSKEQEIYVECYNHHDLFTICDLEGNLKYNIYGKKWDNRMSNETRYFGNVAICNDMIIASYSGKSRLSGNSLPSEILVFEVDGDYIKTLEVGYNIVGLYHDRYLNRIIFHLDDAMQFAYIDLDEIVK
ncbi:6-bladed beta-propeller [Proteiniphilum sp. X52]|uniref:6-bladed beta-propeller n=1 Tax=Proteiniphilum sp. X52 TaxID=2382159 RepID=UPI000F0A7E79|nr:6-bladed beta-propeller [Proteiniphilum sp. X52]RNC63258.1 6-bladed beta-propeller [Proteiniphilum sp. X52]